MPSLFNALRISGAMLLTLIGLLLLYLAVALISSKISVNEDAVAGNDITIFILSNGVHTDIVVPVKTDVVNWSKFVKPEHTKARDTSATYLAFGWGDKGFYLETPTWDDLKPSTAFNAAFGWGSAAMHTTYYHRLTEHEQCKKITISKGAYRRLVGYLLAGFLRTSDGQLLPIQPESAYAREARTAGKTLVFNYGRHDAFYEGMGSYSMHHTCNTWANNALKACEQKACLWTPFDFGIFWQYKK